MRWRLAGPIIVFLELASAFFVVIMVSGMVSFERSFNTWIPDHGRIVKILSDFTPTGGRTYHWERTPGPLRRAIERDLFGSVAEGTRLAEKDASLQVAGEPPRKEEIGLVDSNFLSFFGWKMLHGTADTALDDPRAVALSQSVAQRFFGNLDVVGRRIWIDDGVRRGEHVVRAVFADPPPNTTHELRMGILVPIDEEAYAHQPWLFSYWYGFNVHTFVKMRKKEDPAKIAASLRDVLERNAPPGDGIDSVRLHAVPLARLRLNAEEYEEGESSITTVLGLAAGAAVILFLAAGNFMFAMSARALDLRQGLVLRQMFGAAKRHLLLGFLRSGGLVTVLALAAASCLAVLAWRRGSALSLLPQDLRLAPFLMHGVAVAAIAAMACIAAAMAGPVVAVLRLRPALFLRRAPQHAVGLNVRAARPLVILQFCGVAMLVAIAVIMFRQIHYLARLDPRLQAERLIVLHNLDHVPAERRQALQKIIEDRTGFAPTTLGFLYPGHIEGDLLDAKGVETETAPRPSVRYTWIDPDFVPVYGIPLLAGRNFDPDRSDDKAAAEFPGKPHSVLINMAAARGLGFRSAGDAVGRVIRVTARGELVQIVRVVGVLADALFEGPRHRPEPTLYNWVPGAGRFLVLRVNGVSANGAIARLERVWRELVPDVPFEAEPLDIRSQLVDDELARLSSAVRAISILAAFVAAAGLFGLANHMARLWSAPAAIRRVFGISTGRLAAVLAWEFLQPVITAFVVALPLAWVLAQRWLEGFAYRITLTPLPFIEALGLVLAVAALTVCGHMIRLLTLRPVVVLREG